MATKKYLSLDRLSEYDELIKTKIDAGDESTLTSAKSYADGLANGKADSGHTHDDRYYTETEIDSKLSAVNTSITNITSGTTIVKKAEYATTAGSATTAESANTAASATTAESATKATQDGNGDVITSTYETQVNADRKLEEAKSYTDTKTSGMATTTVVDNKISSHNTSDSAHSDIRNLINELSTKVNNFLDVDDTKTDQLSEILTLINNNKGTIESITSNKVNVSDIVDNLTTSDNKKVLSAKQGVAIKGLIDALQLEVDGKSDEGHGHAISDVSGLQSALDGKASTTHSHKVADISDLTATAAELNYMDGVTSNVQTQINTVSNNLSTHTGNADIHFTATERTKLAGIAEGANKITVDAALSATSTNPVQNMAVNSAIVEVTKAIGTNISSISGHTTRIEALETKVGDGFEEITSDEIRALFA